MVQNKTNMELEVILILLMGKTHLREIARKLNASHSTILRRINGLVKENVLDYKVEGKNKVFFIRDNLQARNYIYSAEKYKLVKLLRMYPRLSVILDDVYKNSHGKMVILFGSYAKFSAKPHSDIDIYVDTTGMGIGHKLREISSKIRVKTGKFDTKSLLIREIIKNHAILRGVEEFYEKSKIFE